MASEETESYNARGGSSHFTQKRYHKENVRGRIFCAGAAARHRNF